MVVVVDVFDLVRVDLQVTVVLDMLEFVLRDHQMSIVTHPLEEVILDADVLVLFVSSINTRCDISSTCAVRV
jgi:hypothetical protein